MSNITFDHSAHTVADALGIDHSFAADEYDDLIELFCEMDKASEMAEVIYTSTDSPMMLFILTRALKQYLNKNHKEKMK